MQIKETSFILVEIKSVPTAGLIEYNGAYAIKLSDGVRILNLTTKEEEVIPPETVILYFENAEIRPVPEW